MCSKHIPCLFRDRFAQFWHTNNGRIMSPYVFFPCVLAVGLLATAPALTQGQVGDSVRLQGRVIESDGTRPIAFVEVTVLDRDLRRLSHLQTGKDGTFSARVLSDREGVYLLAERIGYRTNRTPFLWFDEHSSFELEIRLDRDALLLAPLEVVAREKRESPVLEGFHARVNQGMGYYVTREQIDEANASLVTDLLATVPGIELRSSGRGLRRIVQMSRSRSLLACPTQVYVDGMRLNTNMGSPDGQQVAIDDYVRPGSVEGIEVYKGLSTVPAAFLNEFADCGVVVIWTRRGT